MIDNILVEAMEEKSKLLDGMNSIILSTVDSKGLPNSSYAPSVIDDQNNFFIYISELSKHTSNLISNPNLSMMIVKDESESENIFGRKRFTMTAKAEIVKRDSDDWVSSVRLMEKKFGESITFLKDMTDFHLFKLVPSEGLLVHGFARAFRCSGQGLNDINYLNEKGHTQKTKD